MVYPWMGLVAAGITALLVVIILGPYTIRLLKDLKFGQSIRQEGPETHLVKAGTPTMGGILIIGSILAGVIAGVRRPWPTTVRWCLFLTLAYGAIGFLDDALIILKHRSLGLKARHKLIAQIFLAGLLGIYIIQSGAIDTMQIPFTNWYIPFINPVWTFVFVVFVMVATTNAVNLTDGLDGLGAGVSISTAVALGIMSFLEKDFSLSVFSAAIVGACIGFIWFNSPPAQVFMGDTGSLALGAALGSLGILSGNAFFLPIVGGVFVAEAFSVIIQVVSYHFTGKRVFRMSPLHHHYELGGLVESKIVIRFWIIGAILAVLGLVGYR
jgi:phospho-N-acetylmuramoyl-pentapeptide-transferase